MESIDPQFIVHHVPAPQGLPGVAANAKVTNEPDGLKAGLLRTTVTVDRRRLERVETEQWRKLLLVYLSYIASCKNGRKFGAIGWCIKYEYNTADLRLYFVLRRTFVCRTHLLEHAQYMV